MKKVFLMALFLGAFTTANAAGLEKIDDKSIESFKVEDFVKKDNKTTSIVSYDEVKGDCSIHITNNQTGQTVVKITVKTDTAEACGQLLSDLLDKLNE